MMMTTVPDYLLPGDIVLTPDGVGRVFGVTGQRVSVEWEDSCMPASVMPYRMRQLRLVERWVVNRGNGRLPR